MKKFLIKFFLISSPVFILVVLVNFIGDSANLFSIGYEKKIALEILKGNNVTNVKNYNDRLLQKYLISNTPLCPEIIVVGSSRVMLINSTYFEGKSLFNNGVNGATIEDLCAIIQMYNQKNCFPARVIIGLDPWMLNANNSQLRWKTLVNEYKNFLNPVPNDSSGKDFSVIKNLNNKFSEYIYFKEIFSPSYFKNSLLNLSTKNKKVVVTSKKVNNTFTKLSDGSINYNLKFRTASKHEIEKTVLNFIKSGIYGVENFENLDISLQKNLEFLTNYLLRKNINIQFFLAPYHPAVFDIISRKEKYKKVMESELFFISLAAKYGVKITGSFNPNTLKLDQSHFYDGMHCKEAGIDRILKNVKE